MLTHTWNFGCRPRPIQYMREIEHAAHQMIWADRRPKKLVSWHAHVLWNRAVPCPGKMMRITMHLSQSLWGEKKQAADVWQKSSSVCKVFQSRHHFLICDNSLFYSLYGKKRTNSWYLSIVSKLNCSKFCNEKQFKIHKWRSQCTLTPALLNHQELRQQSWNSFYFVVVMQ